MSDVQVVERSQLSPSGFSIVTFTLFHVVPAIGLGIASHHCMFTVWPTPIGFGIALMKSLVCMSTADVLCYKKA